MSGQAIAKVFSGVMKYIFHIMFCAFLHIQIPPLSNLIFLKRKKAYFIFTFYPLVKQLSWWYFFYTTIK